VIVPDEGFTLRAVTRRNEGAIDWLAACPRKNFFAPIASESTDALLFACLTPTHRGAGAGADFENAGVRIVKSIR
jgi:hypothetical protein